MQRDQVESSSALQSTAETGAPASLSHFQRRLVLLTAFFAWMFAGMELLLIVLIARPAMRDMLGPEAPESVIGGWFGWYQCATMLGAATGGWLFGYLGDRWGRTRSMAFSVLCYSVVTGICYFAPDPYTLLALRYIACWGIGGVWPNAVSLSVEALPDMSKVMLAGLMGAAANVGSVFLNVIAYYVPVTPGDWRWVLLLGASPLPLGIFALGWLPESPQWLARQAAAKPGGGAHPLGEIMRPPVLRRTIIGICLGAIPVIGTSANANWLVPWADQVVTQSASAKALTQILRSGGAIFGSLLGGWLAGLMGRRVTYFLISLASFIVSSYIFGFLDPLHPQFKFFTFILGFVGVTYFGWLPLYLPELFPTRVRSTGTGVTFNSGRILAAAGVLGASSLMGWFDGDYGRVGTFTGLVYVLGMVVICFAPDTTKQRAED